MRRLDASHYMKLSPSDQKTVRKWSRAVLAIYASITVVAVALAVMTSGPPRVQESTSVTAAVSAGSKAPQSVPR